MTRRDSKKLSVGSDEGEKDEYSIARMSSEVDDASSDLKVEWNFTSSTIFNRAVDTSPRAKCASEGATTIRLGSCE